MQPAARYRRWLVLASRILGVQSLESLAAEAKVVNMCPKDIKAVERDNNSSGLWLTICLLCFLVVILAVAFYFFGRDSTSV